MRALWSSLSLFLMAAPTAAQDGETLYTTYCSACHAVDGKGANDGQFPPLAGSAWVKGKPDLMLQVVLHGLMGEIKVPSPQAHNALYNLVMPPQGGTLTDEQIARIATHVRSSWGNKESAVTVAMVQEQREATKDRNTMWDADELLSVYPLAGGKKGKKKGPVIENLLSYVYHGSWSQRPDFRKLEAKAVEEEHKGLISVKHAGRGDEFGIVWEGQIKAETRGQYTFKLDSDDGSAVFINGKLVTEVKGTGGMGRTQQGKTTLEAGTHEIRIEYFEQRGGEDISLAMKGPEGGWISLSETGSKKRGAPSIPIVPPAGEATIYRNFIEGTTPRGIGVGYHGGVNLAFSADHLSVDVIWTGNFMDGGKHWTNRGQGNAPPAGTRVIKVNSGPAFATLQSQTSEWPKDFRAELDGVFRGYKLNTAQEPAFFYTIGGHEVVDRPIPVIGGNRHALRRNITINPSGGGPERFYFRPVSGPAIKTLGSHRFEIEGGTTVTVGKRGMGPPLVRGNELLVPIDLQKGETTFQLLYTWN